MYRTAIKQFGQIAAAAAVLYAATALTGCGGEIRYYSDPDALFTLAELKAALEDADGGTSADDPIDILFYGSETADAVYLTLANARKYVNLDLSMSSVIGFDSPSAYPRGSALIVSLVLPDTLETIGRAAFAGWTQLRYAFIPASVTKIGEYAFFNCTSLAGDISIPYSVTTIGEYAFHGCANLSAITIPESVEYIDRDAFSSCGSLNAVIFRGDGTRIADNTVFPSGAQFREAAARWETHGSGTYTAARGKYLRDGTEWSRA